MNLMRFLLVLAFCLVTHAAHAVPCTASSPGSYRSYRDADLGFEGEYPPAVFPNAADKNNGREFTSSDNLCRFNVTSGDNQLTANAKDFDRLSQEYYRDRGGSVTYHQSADRWYVVSGIIGGNIYYEKGVLSRAGTKIVVLLMRYPVEAKQAFDPIVKRMSHSFWTFG